MIMHVIIVGVLPHNSPTTRQCAANALYLCVSHMSTINFNKLKVVRNFLQRLYVE